MVGNGTTTNQYVPVHSSYLDAVGSTYQLIYPASELEEISGTNITGIKYYANDNLKFSGGSIQISVGETSSATFSSATAITGLEKVATKAVTIDSSNPQEFSIDFDDAYSYNGGNLVVEIKVLTALTLSGYGANYWYGISASGDNALCQDVGSWGTQGLQSFFPKTTFTYEEATSVPYKAKVSPSSLSFGKAMVGSSPSLPLVLTNKGTEALPYSISGLSDPFSTNVTSGTLAVGTELTIPVTFAPTTTEPCGAELVISFPGTDLDNITVPVSGTGTNDICDATDENDNLPVWGYWFDQAQINQMLYPASKLVALSGKKLTKLTFYPKNGINFYSTSESSTATIIIKLANVASGTTFSYPLEPEKTTVKTITLPTSAQSISEWMFEFDETFDYSGGDLLVEVVTTAGKFGASTFYGENQSETSSYYKRSGANAAASNFLPKVKFEYEDAGPVPTIVANPATVDAFTTEVGTPVTATVNVTGENLTGDITASISGDDAFTATLENGVLTITYNPTAAGNHTATVTLSSTGAQNVTIALSGTATAPAVPTITVNPATLTINAALGETKTATFTVTGTNLEGDITVAASEGFSVSPTTIAATDGSASATVTVTYVAPAIAEEKTGTITLTSENADNKTVTVNATAAEVTYDFTVDEESLDFGTVMVGQNKALSVTIRNNGSDNIQPVFTFNNNVFTVEDSSYPVFGGLSQTYNIVYTPLAAGTDNGTVTINVGSQSVVVNLTGVGKELADYDITSTAASGVHNFGDAFVNGTASWSFTITNNGKNAVTPTITGLEAPFSTTYTPAALAAGESVTITISFEPTEIQAYGPTSITVTFPETEDFQFDYTLRGNGIENTGTLPPSAYDAITYTWTDAEGNEHPNTPLTEIATDPDQMIALMREVYTNKNLPGNFYRGYNANGEPEDEVAYPAIGKIVANYTSGVGYSYEYSDAYGWNIGNNAQQYPIKSYDEGTSSSSYHLKYFDPTEYKPNDEGLTLLLVEMRDNEVDDNGNITTEWTAQYSIDMETSSTTGYSYSDLRTMFGNLFKSVRVVPNSKRVTKNDVEGTLFKVDCDKMNRFFFLAKGRLRKADNSPKNPGEDWWANGSPNLRWRGSSASSPSYSEKVNREPFYQMFEQLSPVSLSNQVNTKDVYQALVNMESYNIEHDCQTIPFSTTSTNTGHEFCLYGKESISDDCQDVRDLMFFVPDLRMKYWSGRNDGNADVFVNYYEEYAPNIALYVIRQNEITGERNGEAESYTLHLSWDSNLTDFVPKDDGVYYIYQVNDDGTYTLVGQTDSQTKYLDLEVAMQTHGQQVTYVIQGQDNTRFLSLQMSNEESFIIPGTDPYEKFQLDPNAEYYSRYNPADEYNYYANGMQIMGYADVNIGDFTGNTVNFYRKAVVGTTEGEWTKVAEVTVNSATEATLGGTYDQRAQADYQYGYQTNPSSLAVTTNANGYKVFDAIYDNFKADVSANEHPDYYKYIIVVDGTPADIATKYHSNEITIRIFKTKMSTISGTFTDEQIANDVVRTLGLETPSFDIDVEHSSKTEVLRYGAYRWDAATTQSDYAILAGYDENGNEQDISPSGQASNQGEYYSVYMNGDSYIGDNVYVAQGQTGQATFVDDVPTNAANADEYTYVPVVETFTGRSDYNTYGAPMQTTATGKVIVAVDKQGMSQYTWEANNNTYRYYNVFVKVNTLDLPAGYEVAKVRAWRKIDASYLGEETGTYAYRAELDTNGEFMFDDPVTASEGVELGGETVTGNIYKGTFGAIDVESGTTIPMEFVVRVYFTESAATTNSPRIKAEGDSKKYYITETTISAELANNIPTSIFGVESVKEVAGIKYYNMAGMESDVPFNGVNIEVTRYTDGTRSTRKVMK